MVFTAVGTATASATATATSNLKKIIKSFGSAFAIGYAEETAEDDISYQNALNKANALSLLTANQYANRLSILRALYKSQKRFSPDSLDENSLIINDNQITNENIIYPWQYGEIKSCILWAGDFVNNGNGPCTTYYYKQTTQPQVSYETPSYNVAGSGTFTYSNCTVPTGQGINCVILFTGYSNVNDALNNLVNYTNNKNLYDTAYNYFKNNNITNYLISLSLGGGNGVGDWNTGVNGAIYSVYQSVTKPGYTFSYAETGTGVVNSGVGTGILNSSYNSLFFDIESWSSPSGSTGQDFINLFNYIKKDGRSVFVNNDGSPLYEMIIIVSVLHSCSNYNGTGKDVVSTLLSDSTASYDYISPQLYTQNVSSTTEYCANSNILWTGQNSFQSTLSLSLLYQQYGLNMVLPIINLSNLYTTGGTNDGLYPNLYWYQASGSNVNPPSESASGWITIPYNKDTGVVNFFNSIF